VLGVHSLRGASTVTPADSHWPAAVEILNAAGTSPVVLLCPHASNYIPEEYHHLGLTRSELQRHIAWDLGAAGVVRRLSELMNAPAYLGAYSRLLIDLNRPVESKSSIIIQSEGTQIPANAALSAEERARRIERIFIPYHRAIEAHLAQRTAVHTPSVIVAIHSFTPSYLGVTRTWQVGVLFKESAKLAYATIERLQSSDRTLQVGANVPYAITPETDYDLQAYGARRGEPAIAIEIRQDLLAQPQSQNAWARLLSQVLTLTVPSGS
jgi:predicted N-formylglutamate amidohydrolase